MADRESPKHKAKKNTRKWCKGKVGKPHQPKWEQDLRPLGYQSKSIWLMYTCQACRKVMDSWMQFETGIRDRDIDYERPEIGSSEPLKLKEQK